ncbi:MAG TPA: molybdopterin converting factor subunit 1 [Tepidisphaeraceae bacterium]|jgi:molybdopterin synthase catalytic subunit
MRITVRFFAILKDRAGVGEAKIELPEGSTVSAAVESIAARFAGVRSDLNRAAFAVNRNYAKPEQVLRDGDELALIPPVSGGCE